MRQINLITSFHEQPALAIIDLVKSEEWIVLPEPDETFQAYLRLGTEHKLKFWVQQHFHTQLKTFN